MRIVLEIPDSDIPKEQDIIMIPIHFIDGTVCEAGGYGFCVIPKGTGRLIDANKLKKCVDGPFIDTMKRWIDLQPTILRPDKEVKDE